MASASRLLRCALAWRQCSVRDLWTGSNAAHVIGMPVIRRHGPGWAPTARHAAPSPPPAAVDKWDAGSLVNGRLEWTRTRTRKRGGAVRAGPPAGRSPAVIVWQRRPETRRAGCVIVCDWFAGVSQPPPRLRHQQRLAEAWTGCIRHHVNTTSRPLPADRVRPFGLL